MKTMRPLIPLLGSTLVVVCCLGCLSGCGHAGKDSPASTQSPPELVDARKYLPNAPVGAMIHMPLTAAATQYSSKTGRFPVSLDELVKAGIIQTVPEPPAGKRFFLDQNSMQVLVLPK
jgi:hypothetical protein